MFANLLRPPFSAGPIQVFPLKPAPFCRLCWSRQHQQVCYFSSTLALFLPLCPLFRLYFSLKLWQILQELCTIGSRTLISPWEQRTLCVGQTAALLLSSAIFFSLSPLDVTYPLFSDCRRIVSSIIFDTQVPSISTE